MVSSIHDFDRLIDEAMQQLFSGWDFSWLQGRLRTAPLPWDYKALVASHIDTATTLLDMGTGGGEFLSRLPRLPALTIATEQYLPNVSVAKRTLAARGVQVVHIHDDAALPFADGQFDLIINRHESFAASEVCRILKPGGKFITQQVGDRENQRLRTALGGHSASPWNAEMIAAQLDAAGLVVTDTNEQTVEKVFCDIGAIVYYLKAIPWEVPDFNPIRYQAPLRRMHQTISKTGGFTDVSHRILVGAEKVK